ncbi:baseplate J/gp47 family protein [Bacillus sp. RG28]|uniref:Baseplate J/gp47 family protein n=1 Tax=Gottfriedia endophytica TaxID=2820819 RepID=A0A940NRA1_9BACI|nr:baseplate J/gp47 family protein [Gottfriedia endophytica]MBP0725527.1 baseplate J/gp47 family protein [Gottfriedia endophytica]
MATKLEIMQRMISAIGPNYDTSQGSFLFDAISAVATALEDTYFQLDSFLDKAFLDTSYDSYLERLVGMFGIYRKSATQSTTILTISGVDGTMIPTGSRFYANDIYFSSTTGATISGGVASVAVTCEVAGTQGNIPANSIVNIVNPITGVINITNSSAVNNGTDIETDDLLRSRAYVQIQQPPSSGNINDYRRWCLEVPGVGGVTILPLWNGNGTIKCVIVNSSMRAADTSLLTALQNNVEAKRPIGATVTYVSATELPLNISVKITLAPGFTNQQVTSNITNILTSYLQSIALTTNTISYALIGSQILKVDGVIDYQNLTINGGTSNIAITNTQVAVVGTVNVT